MPDTKFTLFPENERKEFLRVAALLWLLTFVLYLPAMKAGWVIDASWMVHYYREQGFWDFLNRVQSHVPSLYQFTQFVTYVFLKVFDTNVYAWHLLHVTLHAFVCQMLYIVCKRVLADTGVHNARQISLLGVVLFTVCPHISEVVVWEASYHYLQGFLMILMSLWCLQQYLYSQKVKYAWVSGIVYFFATYSLEIFYLTPWFLLSLAVYYRYSLGYSKEVFRKAVTLFFVPALLLFFQHLLVLQIVYAHFAHLPDSVIQPFTSYLSKPPKYFFHILFLGRYFPEGAREYVYRICEAGWFQALFYGAYALSVFFLLTDKKLLTKKEKPGLLFFAWIVLSTIIILPLPLPLSGMLMFYDRYLYLLSAFVFIQLAFMLYKIPNATVRTIVVMLYTIPLLFITVKVNIYWKHSAYVTNRLLKEVPVEYGKDILLLNIPENLHGVGMIGAQPDDEFKRMRETFVAKDIPNNIYDVASFNMDTKDDGAHVKVLNDSMIEVTLNQWGTWWWYGGRGATSYERNGYKVDMIDVGHRYELTLKWPKERYLLLYAQGSTWKKVDMSDKQSEQY